MSHHPKNSRTGFAGWIVTVLALAGLLGLAPEADARPPIPKPRLPGFGMGKSAARKAIRGNDSGERRLEQDRKKMEESAKEPDADAPKKERTPED